MDENQTQDRRIKNVDLTSMMRSSFLDYAMSVIVDRHREGERCLN